jgi:hypothetical protein
LGKELCASEAARAKGPIELPGAHKHKRLVVTLGVPRPAVQRLPPDAAALVSAG